MIQSIKPMFAKRFSWFDLHAFLVSVVILSQLGWIAWAFSVVALGFCSGFAVKVLGVDQ